MAYRRCLRAFMRHSSALLSSNPSFSFSSAKPIPTSLNSLPILRNLLAPTSPTLWPHPRFSSDTRGNRRDDRDEELKFAELDSEREYTPEEKEAEAAAMGYKLLGPLDNVDPVPKSFMPDFAVVQIGKKMYKVQNGDKVYIKRIKSCEVNDRLLLTKVILLGTNTQTVLGKPLLPEACVHAVVEELSPEEIWSRPKKIRKNHKIIKVQKPGPTKLRITHVQGIDIPPSKPEVSEQPSETTVTEKKPEEGSAAA